MGVYYLGGLTGRALSTMALQPKSGICRLRQSDLPGRVQRRGDLGRWRRILIYVLHRANAG